MGTSKNLLYNGKGWIEFLELTEDLWKKIMQETLNGILTLLDSSRILLINNGNESICAGIYTYAIEEYGKLLLLKQYIPKDEKVTIKYRDEFRNHKAKFKVAIQNLPEACGNLCRIQLTYDYEYMNVNGFYRDTIADFEARLAIFYSDFDNSGTNVKPVPPVEHDRLKNAIDQFYTIVLAITIPK
jgi:AbiV family abortive infection protein